MSSNWLRWQKGDFAAAVPIFACMLILVPVISKLSAHFSSEVWCLFDDGNIAYAGYRSSLGELPHMAFPYYYSGGFEIVLGLLFAVFGTSFQVAQWTLGLCMAFTGSLAYYMHSWSGIDRFNAVVSSLIAVVVSYAMNFHIFPMWFAQAMIILGILLMITGRTRDRSLLILAAGACLGVASAMKQTAGIYAMCGFILAEALLESSDMQNAAPESLQSILWSPRLRIKLGVVLLFPVVVLTLLTYVVRSHLSVLHFVMLLLFPAIIVITGVWKLWSVGTRSASMCQLLVHRYQRRVGVLVLGFTVGFLPLVALYVVNGGVVQFISDSFLGVQEVVSKRYMEFNFADTNFFESPLVLVRRLGAYLVPSVFAAACFAVSLYRMNRGSNERSTQVLMLNSVTLSTLFLMLYPNPNRVHLLFVMPMVVLPYTFLLDHVLRSRVGSSFARRVILFLVLLLPLSAYFGGKYVSGHLDGMIAREITVLDRQRGNIYLPKEMANYVAPVVNYLNSRKTSESFIGYDVYNRAYAFLTGRRIQVDYFQRHQYGELEDRDVLDIVSLSSERTIDTIVLAKSSLRNTRAEEQLFEYLSHHYTLALSTPTHVVFQRLKSVDTY